MQLCTQVCFSCRRTYPHPPNAVLLQVVTLVDANGDGAADSLAVLVEGAN